MTPKYCFECGKPLVEGKQFCGDCGEEVGSTDTRDNRSSVSAESSIDASLLVALAVAIVGGLLMLAGFFILPAVHIGSEAVALVNLERAAYLYSAEGDPSSLRTLSTIFGVSTLVVASGALALFLGARKTGVVLCGLGLAPLVFFGFQLLPMGGGDESMSLGSAFAATVIGAIGLTVGAVLSPKR